MHIRSVVDEYVAPLAPAALVTSTGLLLRQHLPQTFDRIAQTRRKYPGGAACKGVHGPSSFGEPQQRNTGRAVQRSTRFYKVLQGSSRFYRVRSAERTREPGRTQQNPRKVLSRRDPDPPVGAFDVDARAAAVH